MTDFDAQLRALARDLTANPPPPPDLDDLSPVEAARGVRRGPLFAVAVAALMLLLVAGIALVRAEFGTGQSAPAPADETPEVPEHATYREPTLAEQLERCDTVTGTQRAVDTATRQHIDLDFREVCRTEAETQPDPIGDMGASWHVENGHLVVQYFEAIRTFTTDEHGGRGESITNGPPVPDDVAAQKVREYHERLDREAAEHPSAQPTKTVRPVP